MTTAPTQQLTAVTRTVAPAKRGNDVILSQTFDVAPEALWEALTTAERLARWFGRASGDVVPGGRYELPDMETHGTLKEVDPPRRALLTWEFGKSSSDLELRVEPATEETDAEEIGAEETDAEETDAFPATRSTLTLRHNVPADAHWATFGPAATGCSWDAALYGLTLHLEDAGADLLPRLSRFAGSSEGAEFTRATADAWYEAHVAAGADRKPARKASVRTAAFYLGEEIDLP
ncbi:SRPBCC domain-containing protein [Brachybacterium aquaticum]|uniref:Uncharacterized protein YndB with AHSA1/START domain n=1 Tax=Brachybacterium aquaticum TaxID=1432564 RepID=A0A841ABP1_9MICO|nr:SRPBCC domain-containing protein [Brachybacterium aquaticum]MBB5832639.1 uncharacterized protein YndB with AHSA1/START domain [Brachybacterium aquaticum]